jgi:serine protease DegS
VTYGWWIASVFAGGPAANAGIQPGDVLIGINDTKILSTNAMSSYLEENTLPRQTIIATVLRKGQTLQKLQMPISLGQRPSPPP